ncbi:hypothetical protein BCR35DRAFT_192351 [Leucosporidium creatinivorum]|uniref:Insulin-like growth factor binding protein n=1 Tax=Leucosporidium creatinivorum TaxID=106004 RepID=A0A1Y2FYF3_9BASI|nr:hypothetical protein BCR35DRAFT_192351 [Leucosporidium creatinivorum]
MRATTLLTGASLVLASLAEAHWHSTPKQHLGIVKRAAVTCAANQYKYKSVCYDCSDSDGATCDRKGPLTCSTLFLRPWGGRACVAAADCGSKWFANTNTMTCERCADPNALTCSDDGKTALSCASRFLSNGACVTQSKCPSNSFANSRTRTCQQCEDADAVKCYPSGTALSCSTKYLLSGECLDSCPTGTYQDEVNHVCKQCEDDDAATCTADEALTCTNGFLYDGACVDACPSKYFGDTATNACVVCSNSGAIRCAATTIDTACGTNDFGETTYLDSSITTCVKASDCPSGTYPESFSSTCTPCPGSGAASCDATGVTLSCSTGFLSGTDCLSECPSGYHGDEEEHACKPCRDGVLTCDADGELSCTKTSKGVETYLDSAAAQCVESSACPEGTYPEDDSFTCTTCTGFGAATCDLTGKTTSCSIGYLWEGSCLESCGGTTYAATASTCAACADGTVTCDADKSLSCGTNAAGSATYLLFGDCLEAEACPSKTFADTTTSECSSCGDGALTCTSADAALSCGQNSEGVATFLASSACILAEACPTGTFANSDDATCTSCSAGALTCTSATVALTCEGGLYLTTAGACVTADNCPISTYPKSASAALRRRAISAISTCAACEDGATKCTATYSTACGSNKEGKQTYLLNGHCVLREICPDWSYADDTNFVCRRCSAIAPGSLTCDGKGALTCGTNSAGAQLYLTPNQNCVLPSSCPGSTYVDEASTTCQQCDDGTTSCTGSGNGKALACGRTSAGVSVFLTASNTCAASCSGAYFADDATSTCIACDDGETSCTGSGDGDALTCGLNSKGIETYLDPSNDCVVAEKCPSAYFADSESLKCVQCDAGEASCLFAGPGGATSCAKNDAGAQLYLDASAECVVAGDCPAATFVNDDDFTCTACADGALICTSSTDASLCGTNNTGNPTYLDDGLCVEVDKCAAGTWPDSELFVCRECDPLVEADAKTCTPTAALTCKTL